MELTDAQKTLLGVLKEAGLTESEIVGSMLLVMDCEAATDELAIWVYNNQVKETGEIIRKAHTLRQEFIIGKKSLDTEKNQGHAAPASNLDSSAAKANPAPAKPSLHLIVELFGSDQNGRKMIAWGRRVGCRDVGHGFEPGGRGVYTRLLVDDANPQQHNFLMELVDYPAGLRAINPAPLDPVELGEKR